MWMLARLYDDAARGRRPRQAEARLLLRRGAPAVRRREQGVPRAGRAGGAAHPLEGRRRLLRHAEPEGRARRRPRPARAPRAARAARVHARRREGAARGGAHVPEDATSTTSRRRSRRSASARRWSRCSAPNGVPTPPFATRLIPPASRMGAARRGRAGRQARGVAQVRRYARGGRPRERARAARRGRPPRLRRPRPAPSAPPAPRRRGAEPPSTFEQILRSPRHAHGRRRGHPRGARRAPRPTPAFVATSLHGRPRRRSKNIAPATGFA